MQVISILSFFPQSFQKVFFKELLKLGYYLINGNDLLILRCLTLSQTSPGFYVSAVEDC